MSAILVKMPPATRSAAAPSDSPIANPMKHGPASRREQKQDAQHQEQLNADQQHADAHSGLQRNGITGIWLAVQAGERSTRVGKSVDPNPEPGHAKAAADSDQAEEQNDGNLDGVEVLQKSEVKNNDRSR